MKPSPANKSAPKARVMWADRGICLNDKHAVGFINRPGKDVYIAPVLVRPCHSKAQAAQLARFANLTWEEKVERVAKAIQNSLVPFSVRSGIDWDYRNEARAVLRLLGEQPGKGDGRE